MKAKPDRLQWVHMPALWLVNENQITLETEPFSSLFPHGLKHAAEIMMPVEDYFSFTVCLQHSFHMPFDECGICLYNGGKRKLTAGITAHDDMTNQMSCTVFHGKQGDISMRDLGIRLDKLYYRLYCRRNMVKLQYSFNGDIFKDMRIFWLREPEDMHISLYACSPLNSSFDAVFSGMHVEEGE